MFVRTSDQKRKKLACPYCNKLVCKLSRHVEMMHKNEKDVQKMKSFPKGTVTNRSFKTFLLVAFNCESLNPRKCGH